MTNNNFYTKAVCSICGRKTCSNEAVETVCGMTQPNGNTCVGIFKKVDKWYDLFN